MQYLLSGIRADAYAPPGHTTIVHGAAPGADSMAARIALDLHFQVEAHAANWEKHGRAAGPIRNKEMVEAGADAVFAFVDKPLAESRGTANCVKQAREAGIPVYVIETVVR